jgi:CspA family cold shock protein
VEPQQRKAGSNIWPKERFACSTSKINEQRGYGFISPAHGGGDVFVRYSDIEGAERVLGSGRFQEGEKVSYEVAQHRKGMQAQNVAKA